METTIKGKIKNTGYPIDGHKVYLKKWDYDPESWHLDGWDPKDEEAIMETIWKSENDAGVCVYNTKEEFKKDWKEEKYEPQGVLAFANEEVTIRLKDKILFLFEKLLLKAGYVLKTKAQEEKDQNMIRKTVEKYLKSQQENEDQKNIIVSALITPHMTYGNDLGDRFIYLTENTLKESKGYVLKTKVDLHNRLMLIAKKNQNQEDD